MFWFDKWHASPYYTIAHALISCVGFADRLLDDGAYWILTTHNRGGSWSYYLPTAVETAYCLQALSIWQRHGGRDPKEAVKKSISCLADHGKPPCAPLWIGKSLCGPELALRSAILGALMLAQEA
jgi:halimadienyl-diphosphate synthase